MFKTRFLPVALVALLALTHNSLVAQGTKPAIEIAFGYECGDRFLVRNDGSQPIVLEYAMSGSQDKSQLHLNAKQQAEIASAQSGNMELWVSGKVVASEPKGNRACQNTPASSNGVVVRPLDPNANTQTAQPETVDGGTTSSAPVVVYADPYYYPYGWYPYPYYGYGWGYPTFGVYTRIGFGGGRVAGRGFGRGRR
jgi:hypothetical protein